MTRKRFPADWATGEILKQYLHNHCRYAVKKGRMESKAEKKKRQQAALQGNRNLPEIKGDGDEDAQDNEDSE